MNFDGSKDLALEYLDDPNGRRFKDQSIKRLINASMDEVKRYIEDANETYFVTRTTDGGTYPHIAVTIDVDTFYGDLPANFCRLILAEDISQDPPVPAQRVDYNTRHPTMDTRFLPAGLVTPAEYFIQGNQIGVVKPSGGYSLRLTYTKTLTPFTNNQNEIPEIPSDWHDLIAIGAAKRGYAIEQREFPPDLELLRLEQIQMLRISMEDRDISSQRFPNIIE